MGSTRRQILHGLGFAATGLTAGRAPAKSPPGAETLAIRSPDGRLDIRLHLPDTADVFPY